MKLRMILLMFFITAITPAVFALDNGSFEICLADPGSSFLTVNGPDFVSIPGWTIDSGSVDYIGPLWQSADGGRNIDMNGIEPGSISQTLTTTTGFSYQVTFSLSGNPVKTEDSTNPYYSPSDKVLGVGVNGSTPQLYHFDTLVVGNTMENMMWASKTYTFTATSPSSILTFASQIPGAFGPALDNVAITATTGYICHHDNGNPVFRTLIVGLNAITAHLRQHVGDYSGPCTTR